MPLNNAPGYPDTSGIPFGGSVGADYRTPGGLMVGAALTAYSLTEQFSAGGHFDQVEEVPSLYAAYRLGPLWGDAVASYGILQNTIARQVPLGRLTDQDNADASGQALALALRGGGDVRLGPVTTGPVVGAVLQRVRIDGFTETGTTGLTALSFGSQTRNSFVTQLGWRASTDLGDWQPFAELAWNHDWASKNHTVTAALTSIAAPPYTVAAAPIASDWATLSLGASYKLSARLQLRAAVAAVFANPQATSYGGELGLNFSF